MIKVQSLRLRGLCASSLLALAACSGTPSEVVDVKTNGGDGTPLTSPATAGAAIAGGTTGSGATAAQDPQGQNPGQAPGRQGAVEKAVANARRSLELRLFEDARNEAAYALELDHTNAEARSILARCQQILGGAEGVPLRSMVSDTILQDRIRQERERALVENELQQGRAHMETGAYGRAIDSFERAVTVVRFSNYLQPNDPLRKEAELMLTKAQEGKRQADQQALDSAKQKSEAELNRIQRDQDIARETRVASLLEAANVKFQSGDYEKTVNLIDQALVFDPTNPSAMALRDLADRARHNATMDLNRERWRTEWNKTFLELQHSTVPQTDTVVFDPARWSEVNRREPASYSDATESDSPENQAIQKLLDDTVLEHNFASATVQDWANYYGQVTGATFFVTQEVKDMPAETTTLNEFRLPRFSVAQALRAIQAQTGVAFKIKDSMVQLVSPANAIGNVVVQPYNVKELITGIPGKPGPNLRLQVPGDDSPTFPEAEEETQPAVVDDARLQELIKSTIATDKFDSGVFTMNMTNGSLWVRADKETQAEVKKLIEELRRHVGIQIDVEARFLKVEDSFLEDVGIDLRGLGNQAAQGLAGRGLEKNGDRQNAGFDDFGPRQQQNAAVPGVVGTGTSPGVFFDDGNDGDMMARVENLYNQTLGGRNGGLTNAGGLSLQYAFLDDTEVEVVLRAVQKQERSEQIEAPRLLVYNNVRASMLFLRSLAYIRDFEVEIAQAAAVANPVIGTVQDGVALDVRPVVDSEMKFITMEVRPTVMSLQTPIPTFTTTLGVGQPISIQLPEVTRQTVRTTLTMPDGGTMMLGGMRLVERQNLRSTVPLLGSLPGLSWLFSRNGTSVQNRKIIILIRAKIVLMEEMEPNPALLPQTGGISMNR
jgi:tetratricopeptide (TPR) repeat protein/Flp pilus assembly secretin CpaC